MPKIVSPTGKPIPVRGIRANAGLQAAYRKKLFRLLDEMNDSVLYWLKAGYNQNIVPELAEDASPVKAIQRVIDDLKKRWNKKFREAAKKIALWHTQATLNYTDPAFKKILSDAGISVPFQMSAPMKNAYEAVIAEQVGLITNLSTHQLAQIETVVMQSVQSGRDLATLSDALQNQFGIGKRRAELIARDQNNKATATMTRARQIDLGITEAIWMHSHAGKKPRPSHVHADGKAYDVTKGMYLDGKWVLPGTEINCRCWSKSIVPGF